MIRYLMLLMFVVNCHAKTYTNDYFLFSYSGSLAYTYASTIPITKTNQYDGLLNLSLDTKYGYVSAQVTSNEFNHVRRLLLDVPVYTTDDNHVDVAVGRLTNSVGFINTNTINTRLNNMVLLPLTTYDTRRYMNLPDVTDGFQFRWANTGVVRYKFVGYAGRQVIDDPEIPNYGDNVTISVKSDFKYGIDFNIYYESLRLHYAFTNTSGSLIKTIPSYMIKYINSTIIQELHFLGATYDMDKWKFQTEVTYRKTNLVTPVIGAYALTNYSFDNGLNSYVGYSYGTRLNEYSKLQDVFAGVNYTIADVTVALEQHVTEMSNWNFKFNQEAHKIDPLTMVSISYQF
jgi:hypothetical protein